VVTQPCKGLNRHELVHATGGSAQSVFRCRCGKIKICGQTAEPSAQPSNRGPPVHQRGCCWPESERWPAHWRRTGAGDCKPQQRPAPQPGPCRRPQRAPGIVPGPGRWRKRRRRRHPGRWPLQRQPCCPRRQTVGVRGGGCKSRRRANCSMSGAHIQQGAVPVAERMECASSSSDVRGGWTGPFWRILGNKQGRRSGYQPPPCAPARRPHPSLSNTSASDQHT
jgi:hypothetical protein